MRRFVHVGPRPTNEVGIEQSIHSASGGLTQGSRQEATQPIEIFGQAGAEFLGDIDGLVELIHQIGGQQAAHLVIGDEFIGHFHPLIGVEQLPLDPDVEPGHDSQHRGDHDQCVNDPTGCATARRRRIICRGVLGIATRVNLVIVFFLKLHLLEASCWRVARRQSPRSQAARIG